MQGYFYLESQHIAYEWEAAWQKQFKIIERKEGWIVNLN